jgi:hypothetical protein
MSIPQELASFQAAAPAPTDESDAAPPPRVEDHPLFPLAVEAIEQAMFGKGVRHGGAAIPFQDQPIFHYAKLHGRGFLTGQAAKKLEEAASTRSDEEFVREALGAVVYTLAAVLHERGLA